MKRYNHKYYIFDYTVRNALYNSYAKMVTWERANKLVYIGIVLDTDVLDSEIIRTLCG